VFTHRKIKLRSKSPHYTEIIDMRKDYSELIINEMMLPSVNNAENVEQQRDGNICILHITALELSGIITL